MSKYRIDFKDYRALVATVQRVYTSDVNAAHTLADALRDTSYGVEVWVWTRKQHKELTERGYRWRAGYVLTGI